MSIPDNNPFPIYYSLTAAAIAAVGNFRRNAGEGFDKVFRIITSEVAFLGLTLFGVIETVIRTILSLIAKGIHFCTPKGSCEWFEENIYLPSVFSAAISGLGTGLAATMLVVNFMDDQGIKETIKKVIDTWESVGESCQGFMQAHIC